jgi:hypothetical protein
VLLASSETRTEKEILCDSQSSQRETATWEQSASIPRSGGRGAHLSFFYAFLFLAEELEGLVQVQAKEEPKKSPFFKED